MSAASIVFTQLVLCLQRETVERNGIELTLCSGIVARCIRRANSSRKLRSVPPSRMWSTRGAWTPPHCTYHRASGSKWAAIQTSSGSFCKSTTRTSLRLLLQVSKRLNSVFHWNYVCVSVSSSSFVMRGYRNVCQLKTTDIHFPCW